jgi:hypothetical protein
MAIRSLITCRAEWGQGRLSRGGTGPHASGIVGIQIRERRSQFELRKASPASALSSVIEGVPVRPALAASAPMMPRFLPRRLTARSAYRTG